MFVYVINQHGEPLMPCKPRKARLLLKEKKVKVVQKTPFTIQLLHGSSGYKQEVSLGVDAGTKHIGLSATTEKTVFLEVDVKLRTDIVELLATRRSLRSARRSRKTRHRKPRFLNRKRNEKWLAPSVQHKVDSHIKIINNMHKILPIKNIIVEVAQFDTHLLKNPTVSGEGYQQGEQMDFWNVREYVLCRDKHTCQRCRGKSKDPILNVHHMESRRTGGDSPANLITVCETCHNYIHQHNLEHTMVRKVPSIRDASVMTVMRWFIYNGVKKLYPHAKLTYGYITKNTRIRNGIEKSHMSDARCISGNPLASEPEYLYLFKQVRQNNRQLHKMTIGKKGVRKNNQAAKTIQGFQLFDKVKFEGVTCFVFGRRTSGYFDLRLLDGTSVHKSASWKKLVLLEKRKPFLVQTIISRKGGEVVSSHD